MMKILRFIALALLLLSPVPAAAQQSSPGWTFGYVPSPAEWSFWFGKKVDWQGAAYCPISGCTFTGPLLTAPSTTLGAGINIGQGVAPTTPNNGDMWMTASGLFVRFNGSTVQVSLPGSPFTITTANANAFAVGPNGTTNPVFNVDSSVASQSNGLNLQGTAVGNGVNLSVTSGAANDGLNLLMKGTGAFNVTGVQNITVTNSNGFSVGQNGATNPAFVVNTVTASSVTGLGVTSQASGGGVVLGTVSSAVNEQMTINAKGNGQINIGSVSSGNVVLAGGGGSVVAPAIIASGAITSATSIGYPTGGAIGGAVTQITSRTTGVTLNKITGAITLFTAAPTVGTFVTFTVTNSTVNATDTIDLSVKSATNTYIAIASAVTSGTFNITFESVAGTASDAPVINFTVIKGSSN